MKEIVGYSMVEPDGSVMMKVPANAALAVEVLDGNGRRLATTDRHQAWIQLRPGQFLECNGCHVANSGVSHGRYEAFEPAYAGAQTPGAAFNSSTVDSLYVGEVGDTMATVRARISCGIDNCSSIEPSMDVEFADVWTDELKSGRLMDNAFTYSYVDMTTTAPTTVNCITQAWAPNCRIIINYETHVHPLWAAERPVLDPTTGAPVIDPVTMLPVTNNCTNCHTPVDAAAANRVPAGQLDLSDGLSIDEPDQFTSYRELTVNDNEQALVGWPIGRRGRSEWRGCEWRSDPRQCERTAIMNAPPEPYSILPSRIRQSKGQIDIEDLSFRYADNLPFLYQGFELSVAPGKVIAIMGPSGSGKSTLTKLLQGFYIPLRRHNQNRW